MIITSTNPLRVSLEVLATNLIGVPKTNIVSASVRVFTTDSGSEVEVLTATAMVQVGSTSVWRYVWQPTSLSQAHYVAEYTLVDDEALTTKATEDIEVGYLEAKVNTIISDVDIIKETQLGRWQITSGNQLILYKQDNVTEIVRFNLFDIDGLATNDKVSDRRKV